MQDWNDGYWIEGMDRCNTILILIESLLDAHPAIERTKGGSEKVKKAGEILAELYQDIGAASYKERHKLI